METMGVQQRGMLKSFKLSVGVSTLVSLIPSGCSLTAGMFVSESKFLDNPHHFIPHILASPPNTEALTALIYKPEVEARLLVRLGNKAKIYGGEIDADGRLIGDATGKIDVDEVVRLYKDWVIPLTKDVEVCTPTLAIAWY